MKILQFTSPNPPAESIKVFVLHTLNLWASLNRPPEDPKRGGSPFTMEKIQAKHTDPNTWWLAYDDFVKCLTPEGALLAKLLFEGTMILPSGTVIRTPTGQGVILTGQLAPSSGLHIPLRIVEVQDLVTEGYLAPEPEPEPAPSPTPTPPAYSWPAVDPEFTVPAAAWMFWEGTPQDFNAKLAHIHALKPWRAGDDGPFMATYRSDGGRLPRFVMRFTDLTAAEALVWDARHITADPQTVTDGFVEWFE